MSDETSAKIAETRRDWKTQHLEGYLNSGGTQGHIMDVTAVGGHAFTPHCLIRFKGRKSGRTIITPLIYGLLGGEVVICASKGGADHHPNWYLNLVARDEVDFQIATQAFRASWREPAGDERTRVWEYMVGVFPAYAAYQRSTARQLPLVMMRPIEPIDIFKAV